jgi:homogentisate 1,2-dioxygenase
MTASEAPATAQHPVHWSREGFVGDGTTLTCAYHPPDYVAVEGPHAPHRLCVERLAPPDRDDPAALPLTLMAARSGARLSVSSRAQPMPFVVSNVEADEVHFVQGGELEFVTDHGAVVAGPGDFVCIPRAVQYRVEPRQMPTLSVVLEIPGALRLDAPEPTLATVVRPAARPVSLTAGSTTLLVKSFDGITRYTKPHDPLAGGALAQGTVPVWKIALRDIARAEADTVGPPRGFAGSPHADELLYSLSARPRGRRPPVHLNADYDEVIYYVAGPGAYGRVDEPGTLTWVPKGIAHHGPTEAVTAGYLAWLFESRSTLRLTPAGLAAATLMETDTYGPLTADRVGAAR